MRSVRFFKRPFYWGAIAVFAIGCAAIFHWLAIHDGKSGLGGAPYQLTPQELSILRIASAKGDCAAAYTVAQYNLYTSFDMREAETYYRLAARCPNASAFAGLINVLRKPEHDAEIDELLVSIRKLDPKKGKDASEDVELRRAERPK